MGGLLKYNASHRSLLESSAFFAFYAVYLPRVCFALSCSTFIAI